MLIPSSKVIIKRETRNFVPGPTQAHWKKRACGDISAYYIVSDITLFLACFTTHSKSNIGGAKHESGKVVLCWLYISHQFGNEMSGEWQMQYCI